MYKSLFKLVAVLVFYPLVFSGCNLKVDSNYITELNLLNLLALSQAVKVSPATQLLTTEAGGTATFTIVLAIQPSGDVTIPLSSSNTAEGIIAVQSLVFTQDNYNQPQTVTVTGVDDSIVDGNIDYTILTGLVESSDPDYNGLDPVNISAVNLDDESAGAALSVSTLSLAEGGASGNYTITLASAASQTVTVNLTAANGWINVPVNVVFQPGDISKVVTVTAVDNSIVDGLHTDTITHSVVSSGGYNGISIGTVSVDIADNDVPQVNLSKTSASVAEGGGGDSYTIQLGVQPSSTVTVSVTADSQELVNGAATATLTFTPGNYNTPQTIAITAVDDLLQESTPHTGIITHSFSGGGYAGFAVSNITVSIADNDVASSPLVVSNILVNGVSGGSQTIAGGTSLILNFSFSISPYPGCPGCVAPLLVGIVGSPAPLPANMISCSDFVQGASSPSYNTSALTLPTTPGTYTINIWSSWDFCSNLVSLFTNQGSPIVTITVP